MGKGGRKNGNTSHELYTWDEIKSHNRRGDMWIVVNEQVYDVTEWSNRHPGGARILGHHAGQDATDAWTAFHTDRDYVGKYMKHLCLGKVKTDQEELSDDFRDLRETAERMRLFDVDPWFFVAHLGHVFILEALGYAILAYYGTSWIPYLTAAVILTISQAQAGWCQHDYGHLSVFKSSRLNHLMHHFIIGHLKGASSHWWNFRHFQHHAKPNIVAKDPDITLPYVFLLGDKLPKIWGRAKRGFMPYNWQQHYFFLLGPPTLLPTYFHIENIYFVLKRRDWQDMLWMLSFFVRLFWCYTPIFGSAMSVFWFYMFIRCLESHWFVWVTQMSHIPMEVDKDQKRDWVTQQLIATCNVDPSFFNDWFSGHLNYQIEHHLFPSMPRHNYHKIKPLVEELCEKHSIPYHSKSLWTAFCDVIRSLKKSGEIWWEAYYE